MQKNICSLFSKYEEVSSHSHIIMHQSVRIWVFTDDSVKAGDMTEL